MKLNVVELFSGIGAQTKALKNIGIDVNTVATCDWWIYATIAYALLYHSDQVFDYGNEDKQDIIKYLQTSGFSINGKNVSYFEQLRTKRNTFLNIAKKAIKTANNYGDIKQLTGDKLTQEIDLLTYSFPCQDLSVGGSFWIGYSSGLDRNNNSRSSLLWEVGRILHEIKQTGNNMPRYLLMENVANVLNDKNKPLFDKWVQQLEELGYISKTFVLNSYDFGLPQTRKRCFMLSIYASEDQEQKQKFLDELDENKIINDYKKSSYYRPKQVRDLVRTSNSPSSLLYKEELETLLKDTKSRYKMIDCNDKIVNENGEYFKRKGIRTVTAFQERHPNSGIVYFSNDFEDRLKWRLLTPRECLLLQGFDDNDFEKLYYNNINDKYGKRLLSKLVLWKLAGNSIPVQVLEAIFMQVVALETLNETNSNKYDCSRHN